VEFFSHYWSLSYFIPNRLVIAVRYYYLLH